jgi:hypothetical protein
LADGYLYVEDDTGRIIYDTELAIQTLKGSNPWVYKCSSAGDCILNGYLALYKEGERYILMGCEDARAKKEDMWVLAELEHYAV